MARRPHVNVRIRSASDALFNAAMLPVVLFYALLAFATNIGFYSTRCANAADVIKTWWTDVMRSVGVW